jgi:hypothetical protein
VARTEHETRATIRVAYVITGVWVISFTVDLLTRSYEPPTGVQALMVLAAGYLFGTGAFRRNGKENDANQS